MTIGDFLPTYERNHVAFLKTSRGTSRRLQKYVGRLVHYDLANLKRLDVIEWFHTIAANDGPFAANHAINQLHALYTKAEQWEVYDGKNPASRIKKFPKRTRERFVQSDEMPRLIEAITATSIRNQAYFFTLLLTGCRKDEARCMQWTHLDLERGLWHKPTTKSGVPHTIPIPARLLELLTRLPRGTPWVFTSGANNKNHGRVGQWSTTAIRHAWKQIRNAAGLTDVRPHDLRRTTASWLAMNGANLPVIQKVLCHSSMSSTQVYARLSLAPVRQALDQQAEQIFGIVAPSPPPLIPSVDQAEQAQEWPG